ncbi:hypothetical protein CWN88_01815 [Vibrio splendidus]|nr:hypothetical protein CWN82_00960 [Vibrio splendidus]PTP06208.1 hypothetical protein CWN88_01815 [Vibrio splendidus]PTQ09376.1 hypothetical protein CWO28_04285 [Vibrio splendidus]
MGQIRLTQTKNPTNQKSPPNLPFNLHLRSIVVRGKGRNRIPIVTCAVTYSAPKKILPLGRVSKGVDELNLRGS